MNETNGRNRAAMFDLDPKRRYVVYLNAQESAADATARAWSIRVAPVDVAPGEGAFDDAWQTRFAPQSSPPGVDGSYEPLATVHVDGHGITAFGTCAVCGSRHRTIDRPSIAFAPHAAESPVETAASPAAEEPVRAYRTPDLEDATAPEAEWREPIPEAPDAAASARSTALAPVGINPISLPLEPLSMRPVAPQPTWGLQNVALLFLALGLGAAVDRYLAPSAAIHGMHVKMVQLERQRSEAADRADETDRRLADARRELDSTRADAAASQSALDREYKRVAELLRERSGGATR